MDESVIYNDPGGDGNGLWLVNVHGEIYYLRAPIKVVCIITYRDFYSGITYYVETIIGTANGHIVYFIFNKPVKHSYFRVVERK